MLLRPRESNTAGRRALVAPALALSLLATALGADRARADPPDRGGYGFAGAIGHGGAGGDFGPFLDDTWNTDFGMFLEKGRFRAGLGVEFNRFQTRDTVAFPELSLIPLYLEGTFTPWTRGRVRPYLQGRIGLERVHKQLTLDRAGPATSGWGVSLVPGAEIDLTRTIALDLSVELGGYQTDAFSFGPLDEPVSSGTAWTARLGFILRPGAAFAQEAGGGAPASLRGPWGVRRSGSLAAGEMLGSLAVASIFNEYVHDSNYVQISPRTWWRNLDRGFEYDANKFDTNHFYHPWNGSLLYSAGRSNGLGFWGSSGMALAGGFLWECCGETLPMSLNDLVSTSLGGVAMGEMLHRLGSVVLDDRDTGASRVAREVAVLAVDTVRGVNRAFSGDQRRAPNPEDPFEWRPPHLGSIVAAGARTIGNDGSLSGDGADTSPVLDLWVDYGSVFDNARRRPYDSFQLRTQVNFTDRVDPVGLMTIRGDLVSKPLGEEHDGAVALVQYFDYVNNRTYEFGAQSLALGLSRRGGSARGLRLELQGDLVGTVLGAVNSRLVLAEPLADPLELRRYEYGPGAGARAEALLLHRGRPLAELTYLYQWLHVTNGTPENGGGADHQLQIASVRVQLPLGRRLGLGIDGELFLRRSHYGNHLIEDRDDRVPQVRAYATWQLGAF
jgi:hypothetical protein